MLIQVKRNTEKTLSPECNIKGENGFVIQVVGDGYCLIEFNNVYDRKGRLLQWYVHDQDFFIINTKTLHK